jgi:CRISPR system Cascade subunit CasB
MVKEHSQKEQSQKAQFAALRWWQSMNLTPLQLKEKGIKSAPTAHKAELKRCDSLDAVMLTQGFRTLWMSLDDELTTGKEWQVSRNIVCWASVAAVLTFIKKDTGQSFASLAGKQGQGDKAVVSERRFAQLQQAKTPDEFVRRLRRIIQQLKGEASVSRLVLDTCQWHQECNSTKPRQADKRIAVRWAMDYYQAAK